MSGTAVVEEPKVIRRTPKRAREFDSRSVAQEQRPTITMPPINQEYKNPEYIVKADPNMQELDFNEIAFMEEKIKIMIHRSIDPKFKSPCTDYIAVNGIPAEMLFKNGWVKMGFLPRGIPFYTKRKYVEVIAKTKLTQYEANYTEVANADPVNNTIPTTSHVLAFSVLEDPNPKGADWLTLLLNREA